MIKAGQGFFRFGFASALVLVLAHAGLAVGSPAAGLTLSPSQIDLVLQSGQKQSVFPVQLTNGTAYPQDLGISSVDFTSADEFGGVAFLGLSGPQAAASKYGLASWMRFDRQQLVILPGTSEIVNVTVDNRADLGPGAHYGSMLVTKNAGAASKPNEVPIKQVVAALVFAKKVGGERYGLSLDRIDRSGGWWQDLKLKLRFHNTGNVHAVPRGTVSLYDPRGQLVALGAINQESGIILPETYRQYDVTMLRLAKFNWPGRYKLVTEYRYEGQYKASKATSNLYYFNPGIIFGSAVLAILAAVLAFYGWRKLRRRSEETSF